MKWYVVHTQTGFENKVKASSRFCTFLQHNKYCSEFLCTVVCCTNLGKFAYIHAEGRESGDLAAIEITHLTAHQDYCLEFYYHMYGSDIEMLAVRVDDGPPPFFLEGGRLGTLWLYYFP